MPISTPTFKPSGSTEIIGATKIAITNKSLPNADTEESHTLQTNLKQLIIKTRTAKAKLQLAFVATESSTQYVTIWPGVAFHIADLSLSGKTLYVQSNKDSTFIEIVELY